MPYGWEGNRRFGVCSNLKPVQLPEQLTFLEYKAFRRITVSIPPARSCFFIARRYAGAALAVARRLSGPSMSVTSLSSVETARRFE